MSALKNGTAKYSILLILLCLGVGQSLAQFTPIAASRLNVGGQPIASGKVMFTPVDANGQPIPFVQGGGGLNSPTAFSCNITSGALTGCQVPDACLTTPANILYNIDVTATASFLAYRLPKVVGICGSSPWALDAYAPPAQTTNVQPIQMSYGTAAAPDPCVTPSEYIQNASGGHLYICVGGHPVLVAGGSVTSSAMQAALASATGCTTAGNAWNPATNTCTAGAVASPVFKYVSQLGCAQNADLNKAGMTPSGGAATEDTTCINTALAGATAAAPIYLIQDGASLVCRIHGPVTGNWHIVGQGGGVARVFITAYSITGNVVTFTTKAQNLVAGQLVTLGGFPASTFFNSVAANPWVQVRVLSAGLSSTQFEANFTHANGSGTEAGEADYLFGTGFVQANSCNDDVINNYESAATYNVAVPNYGSNISVEHLLINGNQGNGTIGNSTSGDYRGPTGATPAVYSLWYTGINLSAVQHVTINDVWFVNTSSFNFKCNGCNDVVVTGNHFEQILPNMAMGPFNGDGAHFNGPFSNIRISDNYFRSTDDPIAFNTAEGFCGPGKNLTVVNNANDGSQTFGRTYTAGGTVACANGNIPTMDTLTMTNWSGWSNEAGFIVGLPEFTGTMSLANSETGIKWSDSVVRAPYGILIAENVGTVEANGVQFTQTAVNGGGTGGTGLSGGLIQTATNAVTIGSMAFNHNTIYRTSASHALTSAIDTITGSVFNGSVGSATIRRVEFNGHAVVDDTGSYTATNPIVNIASPSSVAILKGTDTIDFTNVASNYLINPAAGAQIAAQATTFIGSVQSPQPGPGQAAGIIFSTPASGSPSVVEFLAPNLAPNQHMAVPFGVAVAPHEAVFLAWFASPNPYGSLQTYAGGDPVEIQGSQVWLNGGPVYVGNSNANGGATLPSGGGLFNVGTTNQFQVSASGAVTTGNGFSGTKTAGSCVFTIVSGIITNVTGC